MKPISKVRIERKPGWLGRLWLFGRPRFWVERKGHRRFYRGALDCDVTMPSHVRRVALHGLGELICLQMVLYRGRTK
jgi:hypothetical protein